MSKLFTYPADFRAQKVLIAAQYSGHKVAVQTDVNTKVLKSKSPLGTAPVLETAQGNLTQSNAIARYVAGDKLFGKNAFEAAQVRSWVDYSLEAVEIPATVWVYPILGWMDNNAEVTKKATSDLKKAIMMLENHLKTKTFMVGESISFADVALVCALLLPMKLVYEAKERKAFPCVVRWFTTCVNQPEFKTVLGEVTLCAKKMVAPAPSAAAPAPKKEAKKKAAPAPKPAAEAPKQKPKDPFAGLPKSSFVMDTWKKTYSNPPGGDFFKSMPWLWDNLDNEGYSIWTCKYKFNEDCKVGFMTSNLVTGFIQRTDALRKHAFGTMQILGEEGKMEIVGAWLFRGQSVEPMLEANPDAEYYEWTKVDTKVEASRKEVADLWCADETVYGKPIIDGKVFK